jgi:hypothetical protein
VLAAEAEPFQQLRGGEFLAADDEAGAGAGQHLAHAVVDDFGELGELLVQDGELDGHAALHPSGAGGDGAREQAEQRGLAGAVRAEDAGALARAEPPGHLAQHLAVAVTGGGVQHVDHVLAEPRGRQPGELHPVPHRRDVLDQLVGRVDPELRLGRARRRAAAQPGQLLAHQVLPPCLGGSGLPVPLDALQDVRGVAALEGLDDLVVHLPGRGADLVEEPAVVRDDQQPAGGAAPAASQVPGQPGDALDVEVVGRLVQREDVPLPHQQRGQRDAPPLPAAQAAEGRVPAEVGEQSGDDVADPGVPGPFVLGAAAHHQVGDGRVRV